MAETNSTLQEANVSSDDAIADLLMGGEEEEKNTDEPETTPEIDEEVDSTEDESTEDESDDEETEVETSDEEESDTTWADALGIDDSKIVLNDDGDFSGVNVKIDGETSKVGMTDLIAGYQSSKSNTNKSQAMAEERRNFEAVKNDTVAEYGKRLGDLDKLTQYMNNNLAKEFNNINWNALRVENPSEYSAMQVDFQNRQREIQSIYQAIGEERTGVDQRTTQERKVQDDNMINEQINIMIQNNPEWEDSNKLNAAFDELSAFTNSTYGFTQDEFNNVADARLIELIKDAKKYRDGAKVTKQKMKKKLPKYQKSSGRSTKKKVSQLDKLTKAAGNAKGYQKRDLESSAIAELLMGG